ncbi:MAG: hypothetical protein RLZZ153_1712 [Pseudomonadota bacterium]|jgi:uncharacterized protein (DUF58 family)
MFRATRPLSTEFEARGPESVTEALAQALTWATLRRLDGLFQGGYDTLFKGVGARMSDIREYLPGDDVRHIDWNVTARTGSLHVRTFYEDRDLTAWFLIDTSASLAFASKGLSKHTVAQQAAYTIANVLVRHGNRIAAMANDGHEKSPMKLLPPAGGMQQASGLRRLFNELGPKGTAIPKSLGTPLDPLLKRAFNIIRRRGLVVIVSDFVVAPGWETWLRRLAQRHEVLCLQIFDPVEVELPDVGLLQIEDSESKEQCFIDTGDPHIRSRYADIMREKRIVLRKTCNGAGADLLEIGTTEPLMPMLMRYLALRKKRRHLPAARGIAT